ncbi:MAG: hypothetical protein NXI27_09630 [Alphaproteobacteria bacterium]|nr:hypothetical protein [Alphaproteobacteria bacterium]
MSLQTTPGSAAEPDFLAGPFEKWMLEYGKYYDLPALRMQDSPYRTHVAEALNGSLVPASLMDGLCLKDKNTIVRLPALWTDSGRYQLSFIPFVCQGLQGRSNKQVSFKDYSFGDLVDLDEFFGKKFWMEIAERARTKSNSGNKVSPSTSAKSLDNLLSKKQQLFFRLNYPIDPSTYDDRPIAWHVPDLGFRKLASPVPNAKDASLVITAIIDDGIPFAHTNFRTVDNARTRVDFCWAQGATTPVRNELAESRSGKTTTVPFGREYAAPDINELLQQYKEDEDALYGAAGLLSEPGAPLKPLSRMQSHGAHVLDALSGNWPLASEEQCRIIAVDLPSSASWDASGFGTDMFVLSAMHYIFKRADDIEKAFNNANGTNVRARLVVNLSYGFTGGPHDGSSLIEAALHEMIEQRRRSAPTALTMPSGNTFLENLHSVVMDKHFAATDKNADREATLRWKLAPDDRTSSFLEIWLPPELPSSNIEITVESPTGSKCRMRGKKHNDKSPTCTGICDQKDILASAGIKVGRLTLDRYRRGKERFMIALAPTAACLPQGLPAAPSGNWIVRLKKMSANANAIGPMNGRAKNSSRVKDVGIDCYIQHDISYGQGNTGARQSYFVDDQDIPYNRQGGFNQVDSVEGLRPDRNRGRKAKLRRFGSINGMATAPSTIVVGGYVEATAKASVYSSARALRYRGPYSIDRLGKGVDISAVTERSQWHPGIIGAGTRSGITVALRGTSSAAPQVARQLAKAMLDSTWTALDWRQNADVNYRDLLKSIEMTEVADRPTAHPASEDRLGAYVLRETFQT